MDCLFSAEDAIVPAWQGARKGKHGPRAPRLSNRTTERNTSMARPNYQFEKRNREMAQKKKKEEKRLRKLAGKNAKSTTDVTPPAAG